MLDVARSRPAHWHAMHVGLGRIELNAAVALNLHRMTHFRMHLTKCRVVVRLLLCGAHMATLHENCVAVGAHFLVIAGSADTPKPILLAQVPEARNLFTTSKCCLIPELLSYDMCTPRPNTRIDSFFIGLTFRVFLIDRL